ncbi:hypothetical protein ACFX11_002648 [Malus domestica]
MAPFFAFTPSLDDAAEQPNDALIAPGPPNEDFWHWQVDDVSNYKGSGAGVVLVIPEGLMPEQSITLGFKASNKTILNCLKKSINNKKGKWPDKFPKCVWAYHTTKRQATGEIPFSLAFDSKAIIPPKCHCAKYQHSIAKH